MTSLGGDDERPLDSTVSVYDQVSGNRVARSSTGSDGMVSFRLIQGTYQIVVSEHNSIGVEDLEVSTDQETAAQVFFGRLDVTSRGDEGKPLDSAVSVYDQASGNRVARSSTGNDGIVSFYMRQGVYRVNVSEHNTISVEDISLVGGKSSGVEVDFGRLVLIYTENVTANVYDATSGNRVARSSTGRSGRVSWYLREGTYKVNTSDPVKEFEGISVLPGQTTVIGETSNHPPEIEASANPKLIKAGESTTLTVRAFDKNDDPLTYTYKPSVGTITGEGPKVTYTAPDAGGEYRINIEVSDGQGGVAQRTLFVSGGVLRVTSLGGDDERPLDSTVSVYDQVSGNRVARSSTGSDGMGLVQTNPRHLSNCCLRAQLHRSRRP